MKRFWFSSALVIVFLTVLTGNLFSGQVAADALSIQSTPDQLYEVQGSFQTQIPLEIVWDLLSDYNQLEGTVRNLVFSKVLERKGSQLLVEQSARGSFLFFSRVIHVRLNILENKPQNIVFEDVSKQDFKIYKGRWDLIPLNGGGVLVRYQLIASRGGFAPALIEQHVFKSQAKAMLSDIKASLEKRAVRKPKI